MLWVESATVGELLLWELAGLLIKDTGVKGPIILGRLKMDNLSEVACWLESETLGVLDTDKLVFKLDIASANCFV
jgi:hypothetical protein